MAEMSTTSVTDPNAVKSTATIVSQGVRAFAKPSRIVRSTPDTSCSSSSEVILIKRPKASEAVPNHQEAFMARAENLAGLGRMLYSNIQPQPPWLRKYRRTSLTRKRGMAGWDQPGPSEPLAELPSSIVQVRPELLPNPL